jgi:hypothetical protein
MMGYNHKTYQRKWDERISSLKRKYFPKKHFFSETNKKVYLNGLLGSLKSDVRFVYSQMVAVAKQLKVFGFSISKEYGLPLHVQLYRLLYLTLIVKTNAHQFRKRLLFKDESWKNVTSYDYGQTQTQLWLAKCSFPDEVPIIEDKFRFYKFCTKNKIRTPEVIAVFSKGRQYYPDNSSFDLPFGDLFIKDRTGGKGIHTKKFTFHHGLYKDSNQIRYTKKELKKFIIDYSHKCDLIVQRNLVNHGLLTFFTSGGLSTCRVITVKSLGKDYIKPLFAVLRMSCGNKDVDNYAQGGLLSTVNIATGVLGRAVTYLPYKGKFEFDVHPDTNQNINGTQLPFWKDMLEFTLASHKKFSSLVVGWDVCYSTDGVY